MATLVLSGAGAALGGGLGGSLFGLTTTAIGKAAGASLGSVLDQRLSGAGSAPVETARLERLRIMSSSEGAVLPRCFGRSRLPGHLIWSSRFREHISTERIGGKGTASTQSFNHYRYTISLALALCEGEVVRVGRIWADGQPLPQAELNWRLYNGSSDQMPDPLIAAIEGAENAPAYRGTAYVVIEDLELGGFGNRIPQLNFEVFRRAQVDYEGRARPPSLDIQAVALVPGTGEYSLAVEPVTMNYSRGEAIMANINNDLGIPDLVASLDQMEAELPYCGAVSLVVSWFANDLRIDRAELYPAVEQRGADGEELPWFVSGVARKDARIVSLIEGRPLFGGTPADAAVVQSIRHMRASGKSVMFYPFILLDILRGNGLENPWSPQEEQPPVPWRGRMTLARAAGIEGSSDGTARAADEVAAFFGTARPEHFSAAGASIRYNGPDEWSYRRFILHYASLCATAGGVEAFCIGSEMRSLTQIRDGRTSYPAVRALCELVRDVRSILGRNTKISYAADWSEYFGHQPGDGSGDAIFHLDPFWAHPEVDFVGIDNYMPLSDWRDDSDHVDAAAGSIYNLDYLKANVCGGEGYDWFYPEEAAREEQKRSPIQDGAYNEPWTFRYKDLRGWWSNPHVNRVGGVKADAPTLWKPQGKPIWFTELGCPAVDKGTNQPNVFFDPKSSESFLPYFSDGSNDDFIQQRYVQAVVAYWDEARHNPTSAVYGAAMIDLSHAYVWAWDARPWPDFPNRLETWVDGHNHRLGHWLNGRIDKPSLADVVAEICAYSELRSVDVDRVNGVVTGYHVSTIEPARASLQPLLFAYGVDAHPQDVQVRFRQRGLESIHHLDPETFAIERGRGSRIQKTRASQRERVSRTVFGYIRADSDYAAGAVEANAPDTVDPSSSEMTANLVFDPGQAQGVAERWLREAQVARELVEFALPPSTLSLRSGSLVDLADDAGSECYRVDRLDEAGLRSIIATRVDPYASPASVPRPAPPRAAEIRAAAPAHAEFLQLPILREDDAEHAPYAAVLKKPWTGPVAVYGSSGSSGWEPLGVLDRPATMGTLLEPLVAGLPGRWMRQSFLLRLDSGALQSRSRLDVLSGSNSAALVAPGRGEPEVIQFVEAELVAPATYRVATLLRGQQGTDPFIRAVWPAGTDFFLLDPAVLQLKVPTTQFRREMDLRFGPADRTPLDPSYRTQRLYMKGIGWRPYAPVHLRATREAADRSIRVSWIRRSRLGGDTWEAEIPIGEDLAAFDLQIFSQDGLLRRVATSETSYTYTVQEQVQDGAHGPLTLSVAQVSSRFGSGPEGRVFFDG